MPRKLSTLPLHPILIAVYLVLALYGLNIDQIKFEVVLRALIIMPFLAAFVWVIFRTMLKSWQRAAVITTLLLLLFFSYGHVYHFLETHPILGFDLGRHRVLVGVYGLVAGICIWVSWKKLHNLNGATQLLNLVSGVLILFPIIQILLFSLQQSTAQRAFRDSAGTGDGAQLAASQNAPDVYYIILDGYSRADVLADRFDYDNAQFLTALTELGFYVAPCSQSNYTQTALSMASALNMNYLDALEGVNLAVSDETVLYPYLINNQVRQNFEHLGYTVVAFETSYYWLNLEDVDHYYSATGRAVSTGESRLPVNGFEAMLIRESAGLLLTDFLSFLPDQVTPDMEYPNRWHAEQVLYSFEKLAALPLEVPGPKFVYAHIVAPHSPIVFGPEGEWVVLPEGLDDAGWRKAHTDEIRYVNTRILEVIQELISTSARDPVIILQADHGAMISDQQNHAEILNAYYLPDVNETGLYAAISPVNTFRLIFNHYFGGVYPLLDDTTLMSFYDQPFEFQIIGNTCQ